MTNSLRRSPSGAFSITTRSTLPWALIFVVLPAQLAWAEIRFEPAGDDETGLAAIMQAWHADELERQGGEFVSHGWWPWGLRAFDFDLDGDLDLLPSHHGKPCSLILESHFAETGKLRFTDRTRALGIDPRDLPGADDRPWIWDIDGDGFPDIGGMSDERRAPVLLNRGGKRFEVREGLDFSPLAHPREIADLNGDGFLDVDGGDRGQWLRRPDRGDFERVPTPRFDHLAKCPESLQRMLSERREKKNNRFFRAEAMTHAVLGYDTRGYSPNPIDLNGDGIGDLVVQGSGGYGADYLGRYLLGSEDGRFVDRTTTLGLPEDGCPIWIHDLTGDDRPEILVAGKESGGIYVNSGRRFELIDGPLTDFLRKRGPYLLRAFPIDADNDMDCDLVLSNPRLGLVSVFENAGEGRFRLVFQTRGWDANPIVVADFNQDGRRDIAVGEKTDDRIGTIRIHLNRTADAGNSATIRLRMPKPNPFAVGTVVEAYAPGGSKPFLVQKAPWDGTPIHVGMARHDTIDVRVIFPDGTVENRRGIEAGSSPTIQR